MIADSRENASKQSVNDRLLLPAPPASPRGRAAVAVADRWNELRNDVRLTVEDHMFTTPLIALAGGFLAGRILVAVLGRPSKIR